MRRRCDALATSYSGLSAITDYLLSVKRVAPFKVHGAIELAIGAVTDWNSATTAGSS